MRKLLALFFTVVLTCLTGCGGEVAKMERKVGFNNEVQYYNIKAPEPDYSVCSEADETAYSLFNMTVDLEAKMLNDMYGLNLSTGKVKIFYTDNIAKNVMGVPDNQDDLKDAANGYYSYELNQVFVKSDLKDDREKLLGVLAHEAIHYLYANNNDTSVFFTYKKDDKELGDALIEAITQRITMQVLEACESYGLFSGVSEKVKNSYADCVSVIDYLCVFSIPDLEKYYLTNDFETFRKEFNEKVGKVDSSYEPLEIFEDSLERINNQIEPEKNLEIAFKIIALSIRDSSEENKRTFLEAFDDIVLFSEDYSKEIHSILE